MASINEANQARRALVDKLIELGSKASRSGIDADVQRSSQEALDAFLQKTGTSVLIQALSFLIQPGRLPPRLRAKFLDVLTRIPLRPDGVRATAEFVFSVHPSSTVGSAEEATAQKNGANITQEALNMAAKMIAYPPSSATPAAWYQAIAPQLFELLDGKEGTELMKVAAYVIGFGILGRKQSGAPGTAGWEHIARPILSPINSSLDSRQDEVLASADEADEIIDLSKPSVLVSASQLGQALHRLQALLISHPNPSLSKRLLNCVVLPLWALASWIRPQPHCHERFCLPAQNLLGIYLKIAAGPDGFQHLINNLLYRGGHDGKMPWSYEETDTGDIQAIKSGGAGDNASAQWALQAVGVKVNSLVDLIKSVCSEDDISTIFSALFANWFAASHGNSEIGLKASVMEDQSDSITLLVQVNVLQQMMAVFPSQLASRPDSILRLVEPILERGSGTAEDETIPVALSLLNIVVTIPNFQKARMDKHVIHSIESSLQKLSSAGLGDTSATAQNLSMLLKYRDDLDDPAEKPSGPTERQIEDRKTYNLALSYITQADSPAPVRAQGLDLLQTLIVDNSSILDIPATLVLMSSLLQDDEDYINLKVVKVFTQLAAKHSKTVTKEILEHYVDANEASRVDVRLRFGEALLQVIERLGEAFTGDTARQTAQALLSTAGRRGHRPATEERQKKDERLRQMRHKRAEEEWGGEVPDLGEEAQETEEEKANKELLTQIVSGWDSKKGSEDMRIRASALSILAIGIETNIVGVGPSLVTASVDLCANVLTMEPGVEAGILRRSAVLVILSFVRALNNAKKDGRRLGFGLTDESGQDIRRVLSYVAATDNDDMVRQHASDVIESLDNWKLGSVISESKEPGSMLTSLAGLNVNAVDGVLAGREVSRPRIEEIE